MGAATLALAGLLFSTAALPPDMIAWKERGIQIPINFDQQRRHLIRELYLFASTDQGVTWNQEARTTPDKQFFSYSTPNDGVYWFTVMIVDHNGKKDPEDLRKITLGQILKILVDTQPPVVQLPSAERVGDDITVAWEVREQFPDVNSFRLEYRPAKNPSVPWTTVQVTPAPTGKHTFRVNVAGPVVVRLTMEDDAKNVGQAMKTVGEDATTTVANFPPIAPVPSANQNPAPIAPVPPVTPASTGAGAPGGIVPLDPPPATPTRMEPPPLDKPNTQPNPQPNRNAIASSTGGFAPATNDPAPPLGGSGGAAPYSPPPPRAENRNIQIINSKQITFGYEVDRHGPSGIRRAILYMTDNDGQTWQEVGDDKAVNFHVTANIPGEGVYGFFLVLESGAGLSTGPPVDGVDQPQKRIEVDVTAPIVTIFEPAPDPSNRDTLILRWSATDKNLAQNRIVLEYALSENGPWVKIADVPNSGQHPWKVPQNLKSPRVFLKVTAHDLAGNEGVAVTPKPQLIDLNKPVGRLTEIQKATIRP